jgi:PIN domain nuclease of toxin-antitoxin system
VRLLPDTHLLLWAAFEPGKVPAKAESLLKDLGNELFFSAASIWKVAIKTARGLADFQVNPTRLRMGLLENGYSEIPVTGAHAVAVTALPMLHKDPFDRLLVAQAVVEQFVLLTSDKILAAYPGSIIKV